MYYRSGTGGRCCICGANRLCVNSPDGSTFLRELTSWLPSWNYDIISKSDSVNWSWFTWRIFRLNFIPIRFETTESQVFCKRLPQQEQHESHSYRMSLAIRDHTALPSTQHKWTYPALTPARQAGTRFTYPGRMEGRVDLCDLLHTEMVYPFTDGHPSKY